jgi:transcriptional regulator GlxA family with amidase domain
MSERVPHRVAMVAFADAQVLDVVGPLEVFSRAGRLISDEGRPGPSPYTVEILARSRGSVRVEAARRRLEESRASVDDIAENCGFGTRESMRRAFQRTLRVSPTAYRGRFTETAATR